MILPFAATGQRLDQALSQLLPQYSRSRITHWIRAGRVEFLDTTNKAGISTLEPKTKVRGGEHVRVHPEPDPNETSAQAEDIALDIIYEDDALLVINKPVGLVVHPGSGNWSGTLLNALLAHAPQNAGIPRAGIVHRLDKDTSGLLVVAKTLEAQTSLVRQLQARTVKREYLALVRGRVAKNAGIVEGAIGRHPTQRTRMAIVSKGKPALTHYTVLKRFKDATLLQCRLETGRTHQIRVHMQSIGHPLVGDATYGSKNKNDVFALLKNAFKRQALHAEKLTLVHPVSGKETSWQAQMPADMQTLLETLEEHEQK